MTALTSSLLVGVAPPAGAAAEYERDDHLYLLSQPMDADGGASRVFDSEGWLSTGRTRKGNPVASIGNERAADGSWVVHFWASYSGRDFKRIEARIQGYEPMKMRKDRPNHFSVKVKCEDLAEVRGLQVKVAFVPKDADQKDLVASTRIDTRDIPSRGGKKCITL